MEIYKDIIEFVLKNKYILIQPERVENFKLFFESHNMQEMTNVYNEQMICDEFVQRILPHIFELSLDETQRRDFELLQYNTNYARTEHGFVLKPIEERDYIQESWQKQIRLVADHMINQGQIVMNENAPHTLLYSQNKPPRFLKEPINLEGADFLSAALSKDFELARGVRLPSEEIRKRLIEKKRNFENVGGNSTSLNSFNHFVQHLKLTTELYEMSINMRNELISEKLEAQTKK